jgi:autotransporter-associated beta strand protein
MNTQHPTVFIFKPFTKTTPRRMASTLRRCFRLLPLCVCLLGLPALGAVYSWSGGGGANAYWNNSANWGFAGVPANGDTVIFSASQPNELNTNNIVGLVLNQVRFVGGGGGYDIRGNAFTVTNNIEATNTVGANTIENNIILAGMDQSVDVAVSLTLSGALSGSVGLVKNGVGTLLLNGPVSNSYGGTTTVNAGTVQLQKSNFPAVQAIPGNLVIGNGLVGATVQNIYGSEFVSTANVTVNNGSTWDLNNNSETINTSLTLSGGLVETETGTLSMPANSTITLANGYNSTISGNLYIGGGTLTITGNGYLTCNANLGGSMNVVQSNVNTLWYGANTFSGNYTANGSGYVFLASSQALGNTNNTMNLNGNSFIYIYGNVNLTNQSLTVNSANNPSLYVYGTGATAASWRANFTNNVTCFYDVVTNSALTLYINTSIAGAGGITKYGPGSLTLAGSVNVSSYTGDTTVNEGILYLDSVNVIRYGTLRIGDGVGGPQADIVRYLEGGCIYGGPGGSTVVITNSGLLDLNGYFDDVGPITMDGATINTGAGTLELFPPLTTIASGNGASTINGNFELLPNTTIAVSNNLVINANITSSGADNLTKTGPGFLYLYGNNSYTGTNFIQQGWIYINNSTALGNPTNNTVVSSGATLAMAGSFAVTNASLTLNGPGESGWSALDSEVGGNNIWVGPIILNATSTFGGYAGAELHINGSISGPGGIEANAGTVSLEGSTANTYAGLTTVDSGTTLLLGKTDFDGAIPGNLVINGTTRLSNVNQIANTSAVTVNGGGLLDIAAAYEGIDTLTGTGTVSLSAGYLDVGYGNGSSTFGGVITGGYKFEKFGSGTITLTGANTYSGTTYIFQGTLAINGSQPQSPVSVSSGATLGGTGTVGPIAASGIVSPGNGSGTGILSSSNLTFSSTGNFTVQLTGPAPGTGYDQLNVNGTDTLATATLTVVPAFTTPVPIGQQFIIITNDGVGAITGTFSGLANGAQFTAGGFTFRINYNGGSGNDVVLTLLGVPANTVTMSALDRGWYDSTGAHTAGNINYVVGEDIGNTNQIFRNYFVFNVPVSTNAIIHAELLMNTYRAISTNGQATYLVRKVTTAPATLEAGGSGLVGIYNDLGTGAVYSVRSVTTNEAQQIAIIPLDVQFINDATAASGGQIALGGSIGSLNPVDPNGQYLCGYSSQSSSNDVQLRLTYGTSVVVSSANRGWFNASGQHTPSNVNYIVGYNGSGYFHNFFVFNLPALSSQLVDAQLLLNSYTDTSPNSFENYQLYDVTNTIAALTASQTTATNIYNDLANGNVYGGRNVYVSEGGQIASIPLNGNFLAAALADSGGSIALGGALTTLNPIPTVQFLFGNSTTSVASDAQLWLGFLKAPASHPSFVGTTPTSLGNNVFQFSVSGTTGTTNEIQGSFDFQRWDFITDLKMTGSTSTFTYTNNAVVPYRFFRAEQLQ